MRSVVVLPQPEGPSMTKNSPSSTVKVEFWTAMNARIPSADFRPGSPPSPYSGNFETTMNMTVPTSMVTKE